MNNRASRKPPQEYFAGYESHSQSEKDESTCVSRRSRQPSQAAMMLRDEKDEPEADTNTNRPSGIFKFGSKLAATFNPAKWKIWQKEKPVEDSSIAERLKADAEFKRAYEEVKKRGFIQGNRPGAMASAERSQKQLTTEHASDTVMEDATQANTESANEEAQKARTSGHSSPTQNSNVNTPRRPISQSELESKYRRPFPRTPLKLPAVTPEDSVSNYSPSSTSPRKGPPHLLQGAFNDDPWRPTVSRIVDSHPTPEGRTPALPRKEMDKQLNLVKKVSTLEFKLQAAQEELALAMGKPLPPRKARIGIDYEAIHAIQQQQQQQKGMHIIATTASSFIQRRSHRTDGPSTSGENTNPNSEYGGSSRHSSRRPSIHEHTSHAPLASVANWEPLPLPSFSETVQTIQLPSNDTKMSLKPTVGSEAEQDDNTKHTTSQERKMSNTQKRASNSHKIKDRTDADVKYQLSHDSNDENGEDADSMTTRTASVKRMKSGPRRRNVEVVDLPDGVSKMRSIKGHVETEDRRGRPLRRSGDDNDFATSELPVAKNRTSSQVSVKSTRSSRIPRPRSRAGTPVRDKGNKASSIPAVPVEKLEQASLIPTNSGSTNSLKAANDKFAGQLQKTTPRSDTMGSRETTPIPKQRRREAGAVFHGKADGSHGGNKSPPFQNSRSLTKSGSIKAGLHNRERELSPSKESTFEWGPDVF